MVTVPEQLEQLTKDKIKLSEVLNNKGVKACPSETFTTLVPKVNELKGVALSDAATATASDLAPGVVGYTNAGRIVGIETNNNVVLKEPVYPINNEQVLKLPSPIYYNNKYRTMLSFYGYTNLLEVPDVIYSNPEIITSASQVYRNCKLIKRINSSQDLFKRPILYWNYAFDYCLNLEELPILNLTEATETPSMFNYASKLKEIVFSENSGTHITNAQSMFRGCKELKTIQNLDLTNTSTVVNIYEDCMQLETFPALNPEIIGMWSYVYKNCKKLSAPPYLDFPKAAYVNGVYFGCAFVNVPYINAPEAIYADHLFAEAQIETIGDIYIPKAGTLGMMFYTTTAGSPLKSIGLIDCSSIKYANDAFGITNKNITSYPDAYKYLTTLKGFHDLGKAYDPAQPANFGSYALNLRALVSITTESVVNIINELYDLTSINVKPQRIYLPKSRYDQIMSDLTEEQKAIATNKGWVITPW